MEVAAEVAAAATRVADESVVVAAAARARVTAAAAKATDAIWAEEGVLPVGTPMATPSIAQFIRCNPSLNTMKAKRDEKGLSKRPPLSTRLLSPRARAAAGVATAWVLYVLEAQGIYSLLLKAPRTESAWVLYIPRA